MNTKSLKLLSGIVLSMALPPAGGTAFAGDTTSAPAQAAGPQVLTLQDAQARAAAASKAAELAKLNATAARYHRQAAQADYFPKIGSTFFNLHFNKFMGQRIPVAGRTFSLPLLNKDASLFAVTVTQPVTPLFKVNQAVRIARADERAAQAKADAAAAAIASAVQNAYFALLIAQRQQVVAEAKVKMLEGAVRLAGSALPPMSGSLLQRQTALTEAAKALVAANSKEAELSRSLNLLMGLDPDTQLELAAPEPLEEAQVIAQPSAAAIESNPEVVEAREGVAKARAATRLAKLDYVPDIAGLWGYSYQTAIPLLPRDFSFVGFLVSWNVFDFGKRERTISEWKTKVRMAEVNLELVRGKAAAGAQRMSLDLQRTRRILELTRQVASMHQMSAADPASGLDAKAARAQAEAEMFQADLDFRLAYAEFKRMNGDR